MPGLIDQDRLPGRHLLLNLGPCFDVLSRGRANPIALTDADDGLAVDQGLDDALVDVWRELLPRPLSAAP